MQTLEEMTVGEIAARSSASARVFETHGINFCCSGQIPVTEACLARGLNPAEIVHHLEQAEHSEDGPANWQTASTGSLIDHILEQHHAYLKTHLPSLQARLEGVLRAHSARHGDVLSLLFATFRGMREQLEARLLQQETVLFPLLRALDGDWGPASHPGGSIQILMEGHDATAAALAEVRRMTSNYTSPPDACVTFDALYRELHELEIDLHRHFHLENNILFPRVRKAG